MNKLGKWTIPAVLVGVVLLLAMVLGGVYNGLVASRESVNKASGDLQSAYQRRSDLIPNLVNVVKGSADFEQSTLTDVVEARSKATSVQLPDNATPEQIKAFQDAQGELSGALSRLLVTVEAYPDIKSTQAFLSLQDQLEGTENRINIARNDFNNVVRPYNQKVQTFPTNLVAGMFGFKVTPYFEADDGADKAPTVDFGN
jgi:LemA protein